jgi:hypothetical protein
MRCIILYVEFKYGAFSLPLLFRKGKSIAVGTPLYVTKYILPYVLVRKLPPTCCLDLRGICMFCDLLLIIKLLSESALLGSSAFSTVSVIVFYSLQTDHPNECSGLFFMTDFEGPKSWYSCEIPQFQNIRMSERSRVTSAGHPSWIFISLDDT